ncbi:unnamed protein product [Ceutorhynchus assimilis]|uniref:Uncharacterized protein n=1 Tax=Ceutorhynchus assimilis TaxID=467358 RepID=A0A9N9MNM5_9CUCU|nr:unnamed protein product [Ceutorhynchus assimilis]
MAGIPCTIIITLTDPKLFTLEMAMVVMKQCFRYGNPKIIIKESKIHVTLAYTPRKDMLDRKFGNLPLKYTKLNAISEEEVKLFEMAKQTFSFSLEESSNDEGEPSASS